MFAWGFMGKYFVFSSALEIRSVFFKNIYTMTREWECTCCISPTQGPTEGRVSRGLSAAGHRLTTTLWEILVQSLRARSVSGWCSDRLSQQCWALIGRRMWVWRVQWAISVRVSMETVKVIGRCWLRPFSVSWCYGTRKLSAHIPNKRTGDRVWSFRDRHANPDVNEQYRILP